VICEQEIASKFSNSLCQMLRLEMLWKADFQKAISVVLGKTRRTDLQAIRFRGTRSTLTFVHHSLLHYFTTSRATLTWVSLHLITSHVSYYTSLDVFPRRVPMSHEERQSKGWNTFHHKLLQAFSGSALQPCQVTK
jgi:hypothetical protein